MTFNAKQIAVESNEKEDHAVFTALNLGTRAIDNAIEYRKGEDDIRIKNIKSYETSARLLEHDGQSNVYLTVYVPDGSGRGYDVVVALRDLVDAVDHAQTWNTVDRRVTYEIYGNVRRITARIPLYFFDGRNRNGDADFYQIDRETRQDHLDYARLENLRKEKREEKKEESVELSSTTAYHEYRGVAYRVDKNIKSLSDETAYVATIEIPEKGDDDPRTSQRHEEHGSSPMIAKLNAQDFISRELDTNLENDEDGSPDPSVVAINRDELRYEICLPVKYDHSKHVRLALEHLDENVRDENWLTENPGDYRYELEETFLLATSDTHREIVRTLYPLGQASITKLIEDGGDYVDHRARIQREALEDLVELYSDLYDTRPSYEDSYDDDNALRAGSFIAVEYDYLTVIHRVVYVKESIGLAQVAYEDGSVARKEGKGLIRYKKALVESYDDVTSVEIIADGEVASERLRNKHLWVNGKTHARRPETDRDYCGYAGDHYARNPEFNRKVRIEFTTCRSCLKAIDKSKREKTFTLPSYVVSRGYLNG